MIFSHSLLFDTNVFKKIIRKENEPLFNSLFTSLNKFINPKSQYDQFYNSVTPFLFLEYLGQTPPKFNSAHIDLTVLKRDGRKGRLDIFRQAETLYRNAPDLSEEHLVEKYNKNIAYHSSIASSLYEDIAGRAVKQRGFSNQLIENLALDFIYRFPFHEHLDKKDSSRIHIDTMLDVYRSHKARWNLTQVRAIIELSKGLERREHGKEVSAGAKRIFEATRGIKEFRDLADLDLVQISCLGAFVAGQKLPVVALTSDSKNVVVSRIKLFKSNFVLFNEKPDIREFLEASPETLEAVDEKPGIIAFVDLNKCEIKETINVCDIEIEN
jgi:hypothetical protein